MRPYETLFIINPDLDESETNTIIDRVKTTIESGGGKILKLDMWGKKRLAYPVKHHNDGYYVLIVFESNPELVFQLKNDYQITESIIKYMVVRFEGDLTPPVSSRSEASEDSDEGSPGDRRLEDVESEDEAEDSEEDEDLDASDDEDER